MGEAKRRSQSRAERLANPACCVYCAGAEPATTFDHMPPRAVFSGKHRPKGLEFPSCQRCNEGTKTADQVVALMSRIYPDISTAKHSAEVRKYLQGISNNVPGLLEEMKGSPEWRQNAERRMSRGQHPLYCAGPLVSHHMETFAAKIGFAMHFEFTKRPIGSDGAVAAKWFSNTDVLEGRFPRDVAEILGPPNTLRQGKFNVGDQFEYLAAVSEDGAIGVFLGTFRQSFAVLAFTTAEPRELFDDPPIPVRVWRPGDFASSRRIPATSEDTIHS